MEKMEKWKNENNFHLPRYVLNNTADLRSGLLAGVLVCGALCNIIDFSSLYTSSIIASIHINE